MVGNNLCGLHPGRGAPVRYEALPQLRRGRPEATGEQLPGFSGAVLLGGKPEGEGGTGAKGPGRVSNPNINKGGNSGAGETLMDFKKGLPSKPSRWATMSYVVAGAPAPAG